MGSKYQTVGRSVNTGLGLTEIVGTGLKQKTSKLLDYACSFGFWCRAGPLGGQSQAEATHCSARRRTPTDYVRHLAVSNVGQLSLPPQHRTHAPGGVTCHGLPVRTSLRFSWILQTPLVFISFFHKYSQVIVLFTNANLPYFFSNLSLFHSAAVCSHTSLSHHFPRPRSLALQRVCLPPLGRRSAERTEHANKIRFIKLQSL